MNTDSTFICPVCKGELTVVRGQQLNPLDGFSVYCPHKACPAQEVSGHGNTEKAAYEVVKEKFTKRVTKE